MGSLQTALTDELHDKVSVVMADTLPLGVIGLGREHCDHSLELLAVRAQGAGCKARTSQRQTEAGPVRDTDVCRGRQGSSRA